MVHFGKKSSTRNFVAVFELERANLVPASIHLSPILILVIISLLKTVVFYYAINAKPTAIISDARLVPKALFPDALNGDTR